MFKQPLNRTGKMRLAVKKALGAGETKELFVSRYMGSFANLAAREYELATLGYVETLRCDSPDWKLKDHA